MMAACSASDGDVFSNETGQGGASSSGGDQGSGGSGASDATNGSGGTSLGTGGASGDDGCDKVDFMFVIDNSVSMQEEQAALISSFPTFMQTIQTTLNANSDHHIMVVDTDAVTRCTPDNCSTGLEGAQQHCIDAAGGYACNTTFEACDNVLGAGVVHPAGNGASNTPCDLFGGGRYVIEGEPTLTDTFACMATVGLAGHPAERPMDAMVAALSPEINGAGGCNEGFLRDDAILVITFISDDPNYEDAGEPADWYDAVVAAKNGDPSAVAVLGLTPSFAGCQEGKGPPKGSHWSEFVGLWGDHGIEASVCDADYGSLFADAVAIIDETCDEFEPPT